MGKNLKSTLILKTLFFCYLRNGVKDTQHSENADYILNYQKALFTINLLLQNLNDSIKEGDGERLINSYKLVLVYFKATSHHKYSYALVKLFSSIRLEPENAFKLIWSRFINTVGQKGRNISRDLHLEHLNNFLKELMKGLRNNVNECNAKRLSCALHHTKKIISSFESSNNIKSKYNGNGVPSTFEDVKKLALLMHDSNVFKVIPGREYPSFPKFVDTLMDCEKTTKLHKWKAEKEREFKMLHQIANNITDDN
jgi:hypothetical protein